MSLHFRFLFNKKNSLFGEIKKGTAWGYASSRCFDKFSPVPDRSSRSPLHPRPLVATSSSPLSPFYSFFFFSLRFVVGGGFWTAFADAFLARVFFGLERWCLCRQRFWRSLIIFLLLACGFLESRCLFCGFVHRKREIVLWERERERERI